jgi:hypothetical protein
MELTKPHAYKLNIESPRAVCVCGKLMLDQIHSTNVIKITGIAKPNKIG